MSDIIIQVQVVMGYSKGPQRVCENCTYMTVSDDTGYMCNYNRALNFQVVPLATCKCFHPKQPTIDIGKS